MKRIVGYRKEWRQERKQEKEEKEDFQKSVYKSSEDVLQDHQDNETIRQKRQ